VTTHLKIEVCPLWIAGGLAVNEEITGDPGAGVGVGVGELPFVVVNVRSPDIDGLLASSTDFTL
jgi:hypothetical protein